MPFFSGEIRSSDQSPHILTAGSVLVSLLYRGPVARGEPRKELEFLGLGSGEQKYSVVLIRTVQEPWSSDGDKSLPELDDELAAFIPDFCEALDRRSGITTTHAIDSNIGIIAISVDDIAANRYEDHVQRCLSETDGGARVRFAVAGGSLHSGIGGLRLSFSEAYQVLFRAPVPESDVLWRRLAEANSERPCFSPETESDLTHAVVSGDSWSAQEIVRSVYHENFEHRLLSRRAASVLISDVLSTAIRVIDTLSGSMNPSKIAEIDSMIDRLDGNVNAIEAFTFLELIFRRLCQYYERGKHSHNSQTLEKTKSYVNSAYMQHGLSVGEIADHVGLSSVYLSQFFHEQSGEKLSHYIERVRVRHAVSLMSETSMSLSEIAERSGFGSLVTFRRAFHRTHFMNPNDVRERLREVRETHSNWPVPGNDSAIELTFAHTDAADSRCEELVQLFAERMMTYTSGHYRLRTYPAGGLGYTPKLLSLVAAGAVDCVAAGPAMFGEYCRNMSLLVRPYLARNAEEGQDIYDTAIEVREMFSRLESGGFKIVGMLERGFRHLATRVPIQNPDDVRQMRIWVPPTPVHEAVWTHLGASPVYMRIQRLTESLARGVLDGHENPIDTIWAHRLFELTPYLLLTGHVYSPLLLAMSEKRWETIPRRFQEAIVRAAQEVQSISRQTHRNYEKKLLRKMTGLGVRIDAAELDSWSNTMNGATAALKERFGLDAKRFTGWYRPASPGS